MNPVFGSRKRADEFDLLLSRAVDGRAPADDASTARYADLLDLVGAMRETTLVEPRSGFSADLRSRLMLAADAALAPDDTDAADRARQVARPAPAPRSRRERRIVAAVGGFAIVSATASMSVAAQSAVPGDTLYPLKRAIENAQTGVQRDADSKGTTLLGNAAGRLAEVGALSRSGDDDARTIATTLDDFIDQASEASDLLLGDFSSNGNSESIEELRSFTADSMGALTSLQTVIPEAARASLIEATQVINAIDVQAQSLCPACTDLPIMQAPVFATKTIDTLLDDALGPVLAPILAPSSDNASGADKGAKKGSKGKGSTGKGTKSTGASGPADTAPAAPTVPSAPTAPTLPQQPADDQAGKGGKKDGGLLDDLNVSGSDDPIGDLLTGTGEVVEDLVDDVVKGATDGLGGLGLGGR